MAGVAERAVQTLIEGLKKSTNGDLETRLARILFKYRTTPHSTTAWSITCRATDGKKAQKPAILIWYSHVFSNDKQLRK